MGTVERSSSHGRYIIDIANALKYH